MAASKPGSQKGLLPPITFLEPGESLHRVDANWTIHYVTMSRKTAGDGQHAAGEIIGRHWLRWGERKYGWLASDEFLLSREEAMLQLSVATDRLFYVLPRPSAYRPLLSVFSESQVEEITFPPDSTVFTEAIWLFQAQDTQEQSFWNCWVWYQGIVAQAVSHEDPRALHTERTHANIMTAAKARLFYG